MVLNNWRWKKELHRIQKFYLFEFKQIICRNYDMIRPQYQLSLRRSKMIIAGGKYDSKNYPDRGRKMQRLWGLRRCLSRRSNWYGKRKGKGLLRDDYCDGLGDCLPACPTGAITFVEREAAAYDEAAALQNKKERTNTSRRLPGHQMHQFNRDQGLSAEPISAAGVSQLRQWPCQIKLVPVNAPYFDGAKLSSLLTAQPMLMPGCMRIL